MKHDAIQTISYNQAVFPLKLYEFLAAGIPVVGLNLPSTERLKENDVYEYLVGEDPALFVEACQKAISKKDDMTYKHLRQSRAKKKDWHALFTNMVERTNIKRKRIIHQGLAVLFVSSSQGELVIILYSIV
ncbi:hypothetical protein BSAF29S_04029 [Bacillus safensis subsp. safensis]